MRHRSGLTAALALAAWLAARCTSVNRYYDASKPHHRPDGFNNNDVDNWSDRPSFWRWQWQRWTGELPVQDVSRVPRGRPDLAAAESSRAAWRGGPCVHAARDRADTGARARYP